MNSSLDSSVAGTKGAATETVEENADFEWTAIAIVQSVLLFFFAGVAEILGGWLVWATIRGSNGTKKPWYSRGDCFYPNSLILSVEKALLNVHFIDSCLQTAYFLRCQFFFTIEMPPQLDLHIKGGLHY